jgi:hypothetical protein
VMMDARRCVLLLTINFPSTTLTIDSIMEESATRYFGSRIQLIFIKSGNLAVWFESQILVGKRLLVLDPIV